MVDIFYNGQNAFSGIGPVPFVSFSQEFIDFGKNWNQITNLTFEGQITGQYLGGFSYTSLNASLSGLLNRFSNNFGSLEIRQSGIPVYSGNPVVIKSIDVEQSPWYGVLPYKIEITNYESGLFSNYYGVTDPVDSISYQDEDGKLLSYTRQISAKGFNTSTKNAIQNAKDWVLSRKNITPATRLSLVKDNPAKNFILQSENEVIDRFNGTYSIELVYRKNIDEKSPANAFLNYSVNVNYNESDGLVTADINGSLSSNTVAILSSEYEKLDLHFLCNSAAKEIFNENLSTRPISMSVSENQNNNILNFSASYNNDYSNDIVEDTNVDYEFDSTQCTTTVRVSSSISCKYGDIESRWAKVEDYYQNVYSPFTKANTVYGEEKDGRTGQLISPPVSESITYNELNATINYSAEYVDKKKPLGAQVSALTSSVSYDPAVKIHATNTSATKIREHNIQDMGTANRSSVQFSVSVVGKPTSSLSNLSQEITNEITRLKNNYMKNAKDSFLESSSTDITEDPNKITRIENWTFEGPIID